MSYCRGKAFNAQRHSIASVPAPPLSVIFCNAYSRSLSVAAMVGFHTKFIFAHHGQSVAAFRSTNEQTMWYPTYCLVEVLSLLFRVLFCVHMSNLYKLVLFFVMVVFNVLGNNFFVNRTPIYLM